MFETEPHSNYFVRWKEKIPLFDEEKMSLEIYATHLLCLKTVVQLNSCNSNFCNSKDHLNRTNS